MERALSNRHCLPRMGTLVVSEEVARPLRQRGCRRHHDLGYLPRSSRNAEVQQLIEDRVADRTQRTYDVGWNAYRAFCCDHNWLEVPATDHGLCHFVASLNKAGSTAETAQVYLAAVRNVHFRRGADVEVFKSPRLTATLCGLRRRRTGSAKKRPPVTVAQLNACKVQLDQIALPVRDHLMV